ncbi:MAG TPA: Gfo/Idh/MocA family oxidoreductase [Rhodanobacteraceae bacterium]
MIEASRQAGTLLLVGHSHSFDAPIVRARALISEGSFGSVRMIHALNYTDFLYRPRRPEELDTKQGGGVVFSQGAHQVDIVRLLGGGKVRSLRAQTGAWDSTRPTEGAYSALLTFEGGAFATLTYSGYAHYDSDELCEWIGELGHRRDPSTYGSARTALRKVATADQEAALKNRRAYGAASEPDRKPDAYNQFGMVLVSCDRADLRPLATGVMVYADERAWLEALPAPEIERAEVIDELYGAVVERRAPIHDGAWAMATLEVCLGILESSHNGREIQLHHQVEAQR